MNHEPDTKILWPFRPPWLPEHFLSPIPKRRWGSKRLPAWRKGEVISMEVTGTVSDMP